MVVSATSSLLLLPAPPQPPTRPALGAAYRAPLTAALTRLGAEPNPHLVIAVAYPVLSGPVPRRKSLRDWHAAQSLLASVYTLISAICVEQGIPTDSGDDEGLDARVVLVDHERKRRYERNFDGVYERNSTTVLDLASFATSVFPWKAVFHPSTEAGYDLLNAFLALAEQRQTFLQNQIIAVEGGLSLSTSGSQIPSPTATVDGDHGGGGGGDCYNTVCLGGTFDHLHPGHKLLLHAAVLLLAVPEAESGKQAVLIIGLSADELLRNKRFAEELQSWEVRASRVLAFLSAIFGSPICRTDGASSQHEEVHATFRQGAVLVRLTTLRDPFGPTISEQDVDAIVVSGETRSGGKAINDKRREKGWKPLAVYEIDVLGSSGSFDDDEESPTTATNGFAAKISSTAIRQRKAEAKRS